MSVLLETSYGDIVIDLFTEKCPLATKNFIKLCKIKFYNNTLFYEVQKDRLVKINDPDKKSTTIYEKLFGDQAKYFDDEIQPSLLHSKLGCVSTANIGPNKNNSDFFITLTNDNLTALNGKHTIFGQVAEGFDVLKKINHAFIDQENRPYTNIRILHTVILDDPFSEPYPIEVPDSPLLVKSDERLEVGEEIQDESKRTEQEIIEATKEHKAKTKAIVLEMLNDLPDADIKPPDNILFVCKLNPVTTDEDLELIFSRFGPLRSCEIVKDWKTGESLQYAFIEFETNQACEDAYFKMENALIDERRIHVDFSQSVSNMWQKFKKGNKQSQSKIFFYL